MHQKKCSMHLVLRPVQLVASCSLSLVIIRKLPKALRESELAHQEVIDYFRDDHVALLLLAGLPFGLASLEATEAAGKATCELDFLEATEKVGRAEKTLNFYRWYRKNCKKSY